MSNMLISLVFYGCIATGTMYDFLIQFARFKIGYTFGVKMV